MDERSRRRRFVHLDKAAKESMLWDCKCDCYMGAWTVDVYLKGAGDATKSSKVSLHLRSSLGVWLLLWLLSVVSMLMSNLFTISASPFFFTL